MVTIIFTHPWHGSFNKAIADTIINKYKGRNIPYQIIDLNKDNFNPVMTESELALYSTGGYLDPLVGKYQEMLKKTTKLIITYPIWWDGAPAILKGFFDKVLLKDFAFNYQNGWTPLLTQIKEGIVITTSEQPTDSIIKSGDFVNVFINTSLKPIGITNTQWINCEKVVGGGLEKRMEFLNYITENV